MILKNVVHVLLITVICLSTSAWVSMSVGYTWNASQMGRQEEEKDTEWQERKGIM